MVIPLQYAVMIGVGLSLVLHVIRQSNQVSIRRRTRDAEGHLVEADPPAELPAAEVVVLQPYGSLFFAAAPTFEARAARGRARVAALGGDPAPARPVRPRHHVHGRAAPLRRSRSPRSDSKLVLVSANERIRDQLEVTGVTAVIGAENVYAGTERVGAALDRRRRGRTRLDRCPGGAPGGRHRDQLTLTHCPTLGTPLVSTPKSR